MSGLPHDVLDPLYLILLGAVFALLVSRRYLVADRRAPLPPGPKSSWFGTAGLPKEHQWLAYAEWKKTYGALQNIRYSL